MSQLITDIHRALRVRQVADLLGICVSSVWRLAKTEPEFPKPFSLSPRITVWSADELVSYVETKKLRRGAQRAAA